MSWNEWEKSTDRGPWSLFIRTVCFVVAASVIIGVIGFVANPFRQASRIIDKTIDADNVLYNYEWFKQRAQDVRSLVAKIADAQKSVDQFSQDCGPRSSWKFDDRTEHSRLSSIRQGLLQQRNDLAAEYNARSQMANRSIFKTGDLPDTITIQ